LFTNEQIDLAHLKK